MVFFVLQVVVVVCVIGLYCCGDECCLDVFCEAGYFFCVVEDVCCACFVAVVRVVFRSVVHFVKHGCDIEHVCSVVCCGVCSFVFV